VKRLFTLIFSSLSFPLFASGWIYFSNTNHVAAAANDQWNPLVASNGLDYLTAWETTTATGTALYTLRVDANGTVAGGLPRPLDPSGGLFIDQEAHPHGLSLTPGRDGYFLSWTSDAGLNVAITDAFGVIERQSTLPQEEPRSSSTIAAWNGAAYLVVSGFPAQPTSTLVSNDGLVIQPPAPIAIRGDSGFRCVVADGAGFLVLSTQSTDFTTKLFGVRVSPSGVPGESFLIRTMASHVSGLAAVYDGTRDIIIWGDPFGLWIMPLAIDSGNPGMARQLFSGSVAKVGGAVWFDDRLWIGYSQPASRVIAVSANGASILDLDGFDGPQIATNGTSILATRSEPPVPPLTGRDVIGNVLTASAALPDFLVSKSATVQQNGEIASGATNAVAVWDEVISPSQREVFASIVDSSSAAVQISASPLNSNPAVAFNGADYLVAWTRLDDDGAKVVARRLSPAGVVLDSSDVMLGAGVIGVTPRVASDGTNWLVVWSRPVTETGCGGGGGSYRLYAARVAPDGTDLDPIGVELAPADNGRQIDPDVEWNGSRYVIAWNDFCFGGHNPIFRWVVAGTASRDLSDVDVMALTVATAGAAAPTKPRIAVTPDGTLVAWQEYAADGSPFVRYRTLQNTTRPLSRRRSSGAPAPSRSIAGTLEDVVRDASGQLMILTIGQHPLIAPPVMFATVIDHDVPRESVLQFALRVDERFMGRAIVHNGHLWMPEADFSPAAGADRLYIREFR